MSDQVERFSPSLVMPSGATVEPTNVEWLMAYAIAGFQWAFEALPEAAKHADLLRCETFNGGCI